MGKVLVIGLDGVSWDLLMPWIKKNKLPNFKKLLNNGCWGELKSMVPPFSPPTWTSITTGKNPAKHGILNYIKDIKDINSRIITSNDVKEPRLWDYLSSKNKKSCVINLPITYPPKSINGIIVSGILTPQGKEDYVKPDSLIKELKKIGYKVKNYDWENVVKDKTKLTKAYADQIEITKKRIDLFNLLIKKEEHDLFFFVITDTDSIQHFFWNDKNKLLDYFKLIDKKIYEVISLFNKKYKKSNILIISDHGFGDSATITFNLGYWLNSLNSQNRKSISYGDKIYNFFISISVTLNKRIPFLSKIYHYFSKNEGLFTPTDIGIFLNKENKEKYEFLRDKIMNSLRVLEYSGKKVFLEVHKKEDLYQGNFLDNIPDILFVPNEGFTINPTISKKELFSPHFPLRPGDHISSMKGLILACGDDIKTGKIEDASIIDITPTILHMFNVPISEGMDGKVLKSLFKKTSKLNRKIYYNKESEIEKEKERIKNLIRNVKNK